jgi:glycosyltransferase involved in cell wall biosynthesis
MAVHRAGAPDRRRAMNILLIGNYAPDRQESMLRYAELMGDSLRDAGHVVATRNPLPVLNPGGRPPAGLWKWVGYLDKLLLAPGALRGAARQADIVHVCDHSNAVYVPRRKSRPYVVTCHDLLAVRGALGEDTDCPASAAGRRLQHMVLSGLRRADAIACDSVATRDDARRLLPDFGGPMVVIAPSLNYPYGVRDLDRVERLLARVPGLDRRRPYLLVVGSNLPRKNRDGALRVLALAASHWDGLLVVAGQPLDARLRALASDLGIADRVVDVAKPDNELLEALYNAAHALLFPSRFEGFGWPVIEAQSCGCPVICSRREPMIEVSGGAALLCDLDDEAAFARAIVDIAEQPRLRQDLVARGLANAARYRPRTMVEQMLDLYRRVL